MNAESYLPVSISALWGHSKHRGRITSLRKSIFIQDVAGFGLCVYGGGRIGSANVSSVDGCAGRGGYVP